MCSSPFVQPAFAAMKQPGHKKKPPRLDPERLFQVQI